MGFGETVCPTPISLLGLDLVWANRDFVPFISLYMHFLWYPEDNVSK